MSTKAPTAAEQTFIDTMNALTQRWEEVEVRLQRTLGAVKLRGAQAVPVGASSQGTVRPATSNGALVGYSLRETTGGAAAKIEIRNHDAFGDLITVVNLAAGATANQWFGNDGISYADGLSVVVINGAADGAVFLRAGES
ncbi:MAG: hypothetical protein JWQ32_2074 [Marmoricola sp.]|nr:hypothetical protein [Marmoricola sp.]